MSRQEVQELVRGLNGGRLTRRQLVVRAAALGLSASSVAAFLAACGTAAVPTSVQATAVAAATGVAPTMNAMAPTVAAAATQMGPTVAAVATQVGPTVAAAATSMTAGSAGSPSAAASPGSMASPTRAASGGATGSFKIYSSFPRTGASKSQTDSVVNAIKLALEDSSYKAGNFTIVYGGTEDLDDGSPAKAGNWDAGVEAANATKVVADPEAMVYIATFNSGAAKVSIPLLNQANMAMISPANSYTGLTKKLEGAVEPNEPDVYYPNGKRNYCRVIATDDLQGAVGATYAKELGAKKVYLLDDTELYGHGIAVVFGMTTKKIGLEAIGPEGIDKQATDYRSLGQKIKSSGADMVYFGGITGNGAGKLWKDLRGVLGKDFRLMGPDGIFDPDFLAAAGDAAEGTYASFGGLPPSQLTGKGQDFVKRFKAKYGADPTSYAAYGYDSALAVVKAVAKAGKLDRAAIRDALMATKDMDGALGTWSFDQNGDTNLKTMSVQQVKSGKWEFIKTVQAQG